MQAATQALPPSAEMQALRLAAQVAARLARPIGHFSPSACALPPLTPEALAAMDAHPAFRAPVNRAVAAALGPHAQAIDAECLARLRTSARTRLAALLVSQPAPLLAEAAIRIAAAILHRRIVGLVLKTERDRVRTAFGEAAFLIATQEAPMLHGPLAEIESGEAQGAVLAAPDAPALRERLVALGLRALARFVEGVEPALSGLFELRLPAQGLQSHAPLGQGHCDHVVRLFRRRMDAWSPIIA